MLLGTRIYKLYLFLTASCKQSDLEDYSRYRWVHSYVIVAVALFKELVNDCFVVCLLNSVPLKRFRKSINIW